jgi:hypothetical protein
MVLFVMTIVVSGCGIKELGDTRALLTTAEQRTIMVRPYKNTTSRDRKIIPKEIICAEPSADVATIMSKSFNLSNALEVLVRKPDVQAEAAGKVASALSISQAQALAQLTNRLATIQLLRDGLYRACEAYANGALSDIAYAVMLSGYGDVMVTLLTGELVAGNFGQPLAVLGTSASGAATTATGKPSKDATQANEDQKAVEAAEKDVNTKQTALNKAAEDWRNCKDDTTCQTAKVALRNAETDLQNSQAQFFHKPVATMGDVVAGATGQASASFYQAVGAVSKNQSAIAHELSEIQRKFVERITPNMFTVACLSVLAEEGASANPHELANLCKTKLDQLLVQQEKFVEFKIKRDHPTAVAMELCYDALHGNQGSAVSGEVIAICKDVFARGIEAEKAIRLLQATPPLGKSDVGGGGKSRAAGCDVEFR